MNHKPFECPTCGKRFAQRGALLQHRRDRHMYGVDKSVRREIAGEVLDDLPDGAFFAAAQDMFGLEPEDFIDD